jgi:hypothetical protein
MIRVPGVRQDRHISSFNFDKSLIVALGRLRQED